ncbi:P-loop containing nucleoside triphosphate hydrolase protein [Suillus lakei]|nr:P-loop containing nucleoside triphosphate hydrolase protein [Suillus lakei]
MASATPIPPLTSSPDIPSLGQIWSVTQQKFGVRPCLWQVKVAEVLLKGDHDVLCTAGTGMGKTLCFWIPLLFRQGIQIVITPLNMLGKQNAASLARAGIRAILISSKTATTANFAAIHALKYQAVPDDLFSSCIISIIIDEAHCLTDWGEFRPEYKELGCLHYILPPAVPIMITSATLTKHTLSNAVHLLHMRADKLTTIRRSMDQPNIKLGVKKIIHALHSYIDLAFLIPAGWKRGDQPPPKFLIFFDDIQDAINAVWEKS